MQHPYTYVGCFVSLEELYEKIHALSDKRLARTILEPHVTFEYDPNRVDYSLFGQDILVTIIGYGNDGENEGLEVKLDAKNPVISGMIERICIPHITLSVSETGKSVNTRNLAFVPIAPFVMRGIYGGFSYLREVHTSSR